MDSSNVNGVQQGTSTDRSWSENLNLVDSNQSTSTPSNFFMSNKDYKESITADFQKANGPPNINEFQQETKPASVIELRTISPCPTSNGYFNIQEIQQNVLSSPSWIESLYLDTTKPSITELKMSSCLTENEYPHVQKVQQEIRSPSFSWPEARNNYPDINEVQQKTSLYDFLGPEKLHSMDTTKPLITELKPFSSCVTGNGYSNINETQQQAKSPGFSWPDNLYSVNTTKPSIAKLETFLPCPTTNGYPNVNGAQNEIKSPGLSWAENLYSVNTTKPSITELSSFSPCPSDNGYLNVNYVQEETSPSVVSENLHFNTEAFASYGTTELNNQQLTSYNRKSSSRLKPFQKKEPRRCVLCRKNGAPPIVYKSHVLHDEFGITRCRILRLYVCSICGGTGDDAHFSTYCPYRNRQ